MRNNRLMILVSILILGTICFFFTDRAYCQQSSTSTAAPAVPVTTPAVTSENMQTIQSELQKSGINLTPAEIQKGREMLEKQNAQTQTKPAESKEKVQQEAGIKTADKEVPEGETLYARTRKIGKYQDITIDLKRFGERFFGDASVNNAGLKDMPVPLSYIVGSGDQINILLWGRMNAQYSLMVDRDGKITIPQIGPIYVAGMTYEQMSKHVISKVEQTVGTNIDITIGTTRSIPIFILGDVKKPGAYVIGALATVTDALILAGGPSAIGSMRQIEIRRKNKLVSYFDLYDLFMKGDKTRDITLQAGDVVFVPTTGPQVGIAGNVKRPAIYELKDKFDLQYILELAGGIIPSAYTQQMQVERIVKHEQQIVIDINDKKLNQVKNFVLQDADLVKIFSIVDIDENAVYLRGNVKRPGKYAFKPGMRITDIVKDTNDLLAATHFEYALIKRQTPPARSIVLLPFQLGKLLLEGNKAFDYELTPLDQIFIFNSNLFKDRPFVSVEGEIRGSSVSVTDPNAAIDADVKDSRSDKAVLEELAAIKTDLSKDPRNYPYVANIEEIEDEVTAEKRPTPGAFHYLQKELEKAGMPEVTARLKKLEKRMQVIQRMELSGNMKIRDAILSAGGLTDSASLEKGEIIRKRTKTEFETLYFNVGRAMAEDPRDNLLLQEGDQIIIHSVWEKKQTNSVFISGSVTNPGVYQLTEGLTVRDLIFKAGNVLESAYLEDAEITSIDIVEGKIGQLSYKNVNLRKALTGDPIHNKQLKPNDRIIVKSIIDYQKVRFIELSGQVTFPSRYPFKKGEKLSDVLVRAGGYSPYAYLRGAVFTRERVRQIQQKGIIELAERMERELMSSAIEEASTAISAEEIAAKKVEMTQRQKFVNNLKSLKATGRMTIHLTDIKELKGSPFDIALEDNDTLFIPEKNNVVNVVGSVMSQSSHIYSDEFGYQNYINASGGYTYYADSDNVFIMKVDGTAHKVSKSFIGWSSKRSRWEMTAYGTEIRQVEPGDTIVVPEKAERIAWLREIKDITTILMNIAAVTGIMIAAF